MRRSRPDRVLASLLGLIIISPMGCSPPADDNLPREAVAGTVKFDGQPLAKGTIQFRPATQAEATEAGAMIDDGRFVIPRHQGLVPGKYKVQIDAAAEAGSPLAAGELPGAINVPKKRPAALIPPRYNTKTELTAEVKSGVPNDLTFDLQK